MKEQKNLSLRELKAMKYYTPSLGAEYLRRVRGIDYKPDTLRAIKLRRSKAMRPEMQVASNMSLWSRQELDSIEITSWTKRVEPEEEEDSDEQEFNSSSMIYGGSRPVLEKIGAYS